MMEAKYLQPSTMDELSEDLQRMTPHGAVLAGGTDLMIHLRSSHPQIDCFLSLGKIKEMKGITRVGDWVRIGAMATHDEIAADPLIQEYFTGLSMACDNVGSKQIRNKGTIGGSLANASVAGDMLPCVCLFHGELEVLDAMGETRRIQPLNFIRDVGKNCLAPQEVLYAVWLPIKAGQESCFVKLGPRKEVTIAEISLAMSWEKTNQGFHNIEAVLGAVDTNPIILEEANELLGDRKIEKVHKEAFFQSLSKRIQLIRKNRIRQPKLRIRECEKEYKEQAVKSVVYDAIEIMEG